MTAPTALAQLFQYKRWANEELLALGEASQAALPADDYRLFVRILNHTYVVDRIFASHLQGLPQTAYAATNTEETPPLPSLREAVRASDDWYLQYASGLAETQLAEPLKFRFTDGDTGTMTRGEILNHIVVHGTYHRGAAGRILAVHSVPLPRDSLTTFLHRLQPERRWS
ncbi:DinB family protein [Paenacidovorax monticola]|uniref:DinB family protein n=1 Tax=Paenacidovorax monticola TaxID=1926868 RepID=A0A7H0HBV4_9BURK|nr:DinB family protein [Paenacidovorax monticola]QNP58020.1 DinB family protein [Paenacidovorax monticola]